MRTTRTHTHEHAKKYYRLAVFRLKYFLIYTSVEFEMFILEFMIEFFLFVSVSDRKSLEVNEY